jgi:uncharacterized protein (UPF0262 family)
MSTNIVNHIRDELRFNTEKYIKEMINKINKISIINEDDLKITIDNISTNVKKYNMIILSYYDAIYESDKKKLYDILDNNRQKSHIYNTLNIIQIE